MDARLLKDLDDRAALAQDDAERLIIRAERAGVLARLGRIPAARGELADLRRINSAYHARLSAWILFAEGLIDHFESMSPTAQDRFQRAYAISASIGDSRLRSESAAWIAHYEYAFGEIPRAFAKALDAIAHSSDSDHSARVRAHLVLGDCHNSCEMRTEAHFQYAKARWHAAEIGDIAMQSVVLYNQAADDLARLSLAHAVGVQSSVDVRSVELMVGSVTNLDRGAGLASLPTSVSVLHAQLAVAKEEWQDGLNLYDKHLEAACAEGHKRMRAKFLSERALCAAILGEPVRAKSDVEASKASILPQANPDDLAIINGRIAATMLALGDSASHALHSKSALGFLTEFRELQAKNAAVLQSIQNSIAEKKEPG